MTPEIKSLFERFPSLNTIRFILNTKTGIQYDSVVFNGMDMMAFNNPEFCVHLSNTMKELTRNLVDKNQGLYSRLMLALSDYNKEFLEEYQDKTNISILFKDFEATVTMLFNSLMKALPTDCSLSHSPPMLFEMTFDRHGGVNIIPRPCYGGPSIMEDSEDPDDKRGRIGELDF